MYKQKKATITKSCTNSLINLHVRSDSIEPVGIRGTHLLRRKTAALLLHALVERVDCPLDIQDVRGNISANYNGD